MSAETYQITIAGCERQLPICPIDEHLDIAGFVMFGDIEITERAAEELLDEVNRLLELRQADRAAYQARERALRQQIANVSHDLRTPLTSILGYLQLLEDPGLTEGERRGDLAGCGGGGCGSAAGIPGGDCGAGQDAPEPDYQLL